MDPAAIGILGKLGSGEVLTQISALEETKVLIDQLAQQSVSLLFACSSDWRYAVAEKVYAIGPSVIPELENRIEQGGDPEAMALAALILLKHRSQKGVDQLRQCLRDGVGPTGAIALSLAEAKVPGIADLICDALVRLPIGKDYPYQAATFVDALRILEVPVPDETAEKLKKSAHPFRTS